jgi:hypothetical protein
MTTDTQFIAVGPSLTGFSTNPVSTPFGTAIDVEGTAAGVVARGIGGTKPDAGGTGVSGQGSGVGPGVLGVGGNAVTGGTGMLSGVQSGAAGLVGLGGPGANVSPVGFRAPTVTPGSPGPGVIGQGGPNVDIFDEVLGGADGVQGFGVGTGSGVVGFADNSNARGGANSGVGVLGIGAGPAANTQGVPAGPGGPGVKGIGGINQNGGNADGVQGFGKGTFSGVTGIGDPSNALGTGVFGLGGGNFGTGVRGISGNGQSKYSPSGTNVGVYGNGNVGASGESNASFGTGVEGNGFFAVVGNSTTGPGGIGMLGADGLAGVFDGVVQTTGNVLVGGNLAVSGGLIVSGLPKSAAVPFPDGSHRLLYCLESPDSWFEDFGFGRLINGRVQIQLDPDFAATVNTDSYHVFITAYDDNNGLFVSNRTNSGFEVHGRTLAKELEFSYRVVAKRKDISPARLQKVTLPDGPSENIKTKLAEIRGRKA